MSTVTFECIQCGSWFELSDGVARRLAAKGFDPPLRCPDCRRHKNKSGDGHRKHPNRKRDYRLKYSLETA